MTTYEVSYLLEGTKVVNAEDVETAEKMVQSELDEMLESGPELTNATIEYVDEIEEVA